jgi:hypothetical protein
MPGQLNLGVAKADITPTRPLPLAGFAHRDGAFEEILHPLNARILLLQQEDANGTSEAALIVSADIIWWGPERIVPLSNKVLDVLRLERAAVIFHATHNHSGPQTTDQFVPAIGRLDSHYQSLLESSVLEGVRTALKNVEPVYIDRAAGLCRFNVNRRKLVNGRVIMAPNYDGPADPEVDVTRFKTTAGLTKALLVHYACHPTTTADNCVSSDFPGVAMELVERELGNQAVAAYLQGCCGDVRPDLTSGQRFYRGHDTDVQRLARLLADEVLAILRRPMRPCSPARLVSHRSVLSLYYQALPTTPGLQATRQRTDVIGEWSRLLLDHPERLRPGIALISHLLRIADEVSLLTTNAEMVAQYGLFVKRQFAARILPVAYSNGMIGYVPTAEQLNEGGYEAIDSHYYFGLPAPFARSVEERICRNIAALCQNVYE